MKLSKTAFSSQPLVANADTHAHLKVCPCCCDKLLQHIRHHRVYWFCRTCWQEMPLTQVRKPDLLQRKKDDTTSPRNSQLLWQRQSGNTDQPSTIAEPW